MAVSAGRGLADRTGGGVSHHPEPAHDCVRDACVAARNLRGVGMRMRAVWFEPRRRACCRDGRRTGSSARDRRWSTPARSSHHGGTNFKLIATENLTIGIMPITAVPCWSRHGGPPRRFRRDVPLRGPRSNIRGRGICRDAATAAGGGCGQRPGNRRCSRSAIDARSSPGPRSRPGQSSSARLRRPAPRHDRPAARRLARDRGSGATSREAAFRGIAPGCAHCGA